jgi:ornithine carbamoyltransferase
MNQTLHPRGLWSLDELTSSDAQALLSTARALKQIKGGGAPLRGKHVALLCERPLRAAADVFTAAARGLGAQVTRIRPSASRLTETDDLHDAARILGRLYDAIECDGMSQAFMLELARTAAVPVSNVLLQERHPTRMLADVMTMQEIGARSFDKLTVRVVGDERAPWSAAWRQMSAVTGIGVVAGTPQVPAVEPLRIAFVCDPQGARCADGQPALVVLRRDDPRVVSLASRQVVNHRFVVQALLTHTIN